MSNMVERVAAILRSHYQCRELVTDEEFEEWQKVMARAAIGAMREITPEMRNAFHDGAPHYISYVIVDEGWKRAIDAALKP